MRMFAGLLIGVSLAAAALHAAPAVAQYPNKAVRDSGMPLD